LIGGSGSNSSCAMLCSTAVATITADAVKGVILKPNASATNLRFHIPKLLSMTFCVRI